MEPAAELVAELVGGKPKEQKPAPAPPTRDEAAAKAKAQMDEEERKRALIALGQAGTIFGGLAGLQQTETGAARTLGGS